MQLDKSVIDNLLKEKGIMGLKPFYMPSLTKDVYMYYKEEDNHKYIHFCDSKLNELSRNEIGLGNGVLFILGTNERYSILEECTHVKGHYKQHSKAGADIGWLIDRNNTIVESSIEGYYKLSNKYIVLNSTVINIKDSLKNNIWVPNNSYWVYNTESNKIDSDYYGRLLSYHVFMEAGKGICIINDEGESIVDISAIWYNDDSIKAISINWGDDSFLDFYDLVKGEKERIYLPIATELGVDTHFRFFGDGNVIVVRYVCCKNYFDYPDERIWNPYLFIINNGDFLHHGPMPNNTEINSVKNGIITISEKTRVYNTYGCYGHESERFSFYDFQYCKIGCAYSLDNKYIVINRECAKIGTPGFGKDILYGILDIRNMSVILPIKYNTISILSKEDEDLYAIIGITEGEGVEKITKYGLFVKDQFVLPIENEEFVYSKYSLKEILYMKDGKYGLVYNGKLCLNSDYASIKYKNNFYLLSNGDKKGFYNPKKGFTSPLVFNDIVYVDDSVFVADNEIFLYDDKQIEKLTNNSGLYIFEDCTAGYYMFTEDEECGDIDERRICYYINKDEICKARIEELDPYSREYSEYPIDTEKTFLIIDDAYYYNLTNEHFVDFDEMMCKSDYYDTNEDVCEDLYEDYERDTFYALGGDDYEEWRNNGGNLDDMMDGMGY